MCSRVISNPSLWPLGPTLSTEQVARSYDSGLAINVLYICMAVVYVLKLLITIILNDDVIFYDV